MGALPWGLEFDVSDLSEFSDHEVEAVDLEGGHWAVPVARTPGFAVRSLPRPEGWGDEGEASEEVRVSSLTHWI